MEKKQTGIAHDSESSSTISCIDRINIELSKKISIDTTDNELSKEREDELLFGAEEEGDDEDVLSDDSLRLRLSDDEDVEQEDNIANSTNITEFKLQNRQSGIYYFLFIKLKILLNSNILLINFFIDFFNIIMFNLTQYKYLFF